jgi:ATP-binding cassette subfamily F protein 3
MLARVLIQAEGCELLFLDEPTSHLDVDTVEWLEDYLLDSHCSIMVVSHDRYFLDKVSTRVAEISNGRTRDYKGNYSAFVMKKMLELERQEKEYRRYSSQKKRLEDIAEEQHRNNWFSSLHKTTQKRIDKLEEKSAPEERTEIKVRIQAASKSGKNVILGKGLRVDFGDRTIFDDVDIEVHKGDKLGIFGPNGEGKSTLVKALIGKIPCQGELWLAPGAKVGYYSQNHERLQLHLSAEEQILQAIGVDRKAEARGLLARMMLTGETVERPMSTLSGGERARVALTLMLLEDTNLLVLDEPTNYLDIPVRHAVESALNDYDGTIIVVTHDRYLLDSVCNRVGELRDGRLHTYNGTYSEMKGRKNVMEIVEDADEYRALSSFTNWVTGKKYSKGDRVLIAPSELKNFQWAMENEKLKRTGGRQRKKVAVEKIEEEEE